jgi:hypothetical protein
MKSQRRSKSLETLARSVKDSEQFVAHVCNVAAAYSKHHAIDSAAHRDVRQALRTCAKHAEALSQWLHSAARGSASSIESQALRQLGMATSNPRWIGQSIGMRGWLAQLAQASTVACEAPPRDLQQAALRGAVEGLRATFERHGIKLSQRAPEQKHSDAVRLLCALVSVSGTLELEPAEARQLLKSAKSPAKTGEARPIQSARGDKQAAPIARLKVRDGASRRRK